MLVKYIKKVPFLWNIYLNLHFLKTKKRIKQLEKIDESKYPELLSKQYYERTGDKLDWGSINTYTEKMQWAKLYDRDPRKTEYADKYRVRKYIKEKVGDQYLIPLLGVYECFDDIDFGKLPNEFVIKTNHGSNTNIIVRDKKKFDRKKARKQFNRWLKTDWSLVSGFELHYRNIKPCIIIEKLIGGGKNFVIINSCAFLVRFIMFGWTLTDTRNIKETYMI